MQVVNIETFVNKTRFVGQFDDSPFYDIIPKVESRVRLEPNKSDETKRSFEFHLNLSGEMNFPKNVSYYFSVMDIVYFDNKGIVPTADELLTFCSDAYKRIAQKLKDELMDKKIKLSKTIKIQSTKDEIRKKIQKEVQRISQH